MGNPTRIADVLAAMPGTEADITLASGLGRMTVFRHVLQLHQDGKCHIIRWKRPPKGRMTPVYAAGPGEDAPCLLRIFTEAETSKRYRTRKTKRATPFDSLYGGRRN